MGQTWGKSTEQSDRNPKGGVIPPDRSATSPNPARFEDKEGHQQHEGGAEAGDVYG